MTLSLEEMKANRKLWVEALRSGKYRQGRNLLHGPDGMCCLGVLCDVAGLPWEDQGDGRYMAGDETRVAPRAAMDFVGLKNNCGGYAVAGDDDEDGFYKELTEFNDSGMSFEAIATIIASEPPGLFVESAP